MTHIRTALQAAVAAALVAAMATTAPAPATQPDDAAACDTGSWVAGTVDLCAGELVYRDYIYDDHGAATPNFLPRAGAYAGVPPTGDQEYTGEANTADLAALRLRIDGDALDVSFELNSLVEPDSTVAALAIDTDNDTATGGGSWPGALGVTSAGWDVVHTFSHGDAGTNRIDGSVPLPRGNTWRLQAVTAQAGGPVMNVAFRGTGETGFWWEDRQAAALQAGDISSFAGEVDVADLRNRVTRRAETPRGKVLQRVYTSAHPIPPGEGIGEVPGRSTASTPIGFGGQFFYFLGKYQPYGFYLPNKPGPHGSQLVMHGFLENHSARIFFPGTQHRITDHIGEARNRILVSPLGRGPSGWYSDWAERDVLDALADAEKTYGTDPDRRFASGYSMGGYGTYRLAGLYPDRFAGFIAWVGWTGDVFNGVPPFQGRGGQAGSVGNPYEFVGNLRWVPGAMVYGAADELVHAETAVFMQREFERQRVRHVWYMHPTLDHVLYIPLDDWRKESAYSADLVLVKDPPRVTFKTDPELGNPSLGLVHDRAYWVTDIRNRAPGFAEIDITSHGCGGSLSTLTPRQGAGESPVPWVSLGMEVTGQEPLSKENRLVATVFNTASFNVGKGSCLTDGDLFYKVTTDGPVALAFPDARVLSLTAAGTHEGVLPALAPPPPAAAPLPQTGDDDGRLPATGGAGPGALAAAMLALAFWTRRCGS